MKVTGFPTSSDIYLELDGKKIAVIKESFGNAFAPYLAQRSSLRSPRALRSKALRGI